MTPLSSRPRRRFWFVLGALGLLAGLAYGRSRGKPGAGEPAAPAVGQQVVLVELFSSEGCSSCPPADALLRELDGAGQGNARVIALEFHVDYWDDLGWKDPFGSEAWSERQRDYAAVLGGGLYTPEMIVDGREAFVGSDAKHARDALERAAGRRHLVVELVRTGNSLRIEVPKVAGPAATAWLAVTERDLQTRVERGENAGRTLPHAPIVRSLQRLGDAAGGVVRTMDVPPSKSRLSFAVFIQRNESREVLGAAAL